MGRPTEPNSVNIIATVSAMPEEHTDLVGAILRDSAYMIESQFGVPKGGQLNILHLGYGVTDGGTPWAGAVFELVTANGAAKRMYWANQFDFRRDDEDGLTVSPTNGYVTAEAHCYMGDTWKNPSVWGVYFAEIFTFTTHETRSTGNFTSVFDPYSGEWTN